MGDKRIRITTVSQKYIMALAGIFLMLFLVVHLSINLLMVVGDDGKLFGQAVQFMLTNPLIKITEYVLFGGFIVHILLGVILWAVNNRARPVKYSKSLKTENSMFSKYMIHTGVIILIFLFIHFFHFFFVKAGIVPIPEVAEGDKHDFFSMAVVTFQNPLYSFIYLVSFVFLGFHLKHAFQSAFQSLGLNHNKYTPAIKFIGTLYAIVISVGFAIIPIYFYFFY